MEPNLNNELENAMPETDELIHETEVSEIVKAETDEVGATSKEGMLTEDETPYRPIGQTVRFTYMIRMKDQLGFLARYAFGGLNGLAFWLVLGLLIVRFAYGWKTDVASTKAMLVFGAFILIVLMPGNLFIRAFTQCKLAKMNNLYATYEISDAGIYVTQETEHQLFEWNAITKVKQNKNVIYLYVYKNSAFICPKDILGDGDWDTLQTIVAKNYKAK